MILAALGEMEVALPLAALFAAYWLYRWATIPAAWSQCPSPPRLPVLGNLHETRDPRRVLDAAQRYARDMPLMVGLWFGPWTMQLMTYHPDTVKVVLKAGTPKNFFYNFLHPWLGTGLLTSEGKKWKARRRMITPAFHFEVLRGYHAVFARHAAVLCDKWDAVCRGADNGSAEIDVFHDVTLCTLDVICDAAMGVKLGAQGGSSAFYVDAVVTASRGVYRRMVNPLLWYDWLHALTPWGWQSARAVKVLHDFTMSVIHKRQEVLSGNAAAATASTASTASAQGTTLPSSRHLDFLDLLLSARDEDGEPLADRDIQEEVDTFIFEGHDTTATAVSFTLHLLANHPEAQARARAEADAALLARKDSGGGGGGNVINDVTLARLPFVWACVREAMRLYPSVPMLGRRLTEDTEIGGIVMPRGTVVNVIPFVLHRNPAVWDRPEEYLPERFLEGGSAADMDPFAFVPFSAGPRNCVGMKFASAEMRVAVASILHRFVLRPGTHPPIVTRPEVILRPENGIHLIVEPRKRE
jgi:cytochrome P450